MGEVQGNILQAPRAPFDRTWGNKQSNHRARKAYSVPWFNRVDGSISVVPGLLFYFDVYLQMHVVFSWFGFSYFSLIGTLTAALT